MPIKAILFDIDGTLVDSNDFHVRAWQEALAAAGHRFDVRQIRQQIGKGTDMLVPALLPDLDQKGREELGDAHGQIFKNQYLEQVVPFAQARAVLAEASRRRQRVVLASSASQEELDHYVRLLDAIGLIDASTSSDDVESTKPAPDIFAIALKKLEGISPDEAIVVGDTPYDIAAAKKCGIAAVGLRSGKFADEALRGAGAVAIYDDVAALLEGYDSSPLVG